MDATPEHVQPEQAHKSTLDDYASEPPSRLERAGHVAKTGARRTVAGVVVVAAVVGVYFILSTTALKWWSEQVGDLVGDDSNKGLWLGLLIGFAFTFAVVVLLVYALRKMVSNFALSLVTLVLCAILASPILLTLAVQFGGDADAVEGRRIIDERADIFPTAIWIGVIIGLIVGFIVAVGLAAVSRNRAHKKTRKAAERAEARAAKDAARRQKAEAEATERASDTRTEGLD